MARILSDETSLSRWRDQLASESRVLVYLGYAELAAAGLLLIGGTAVYLLRGTSGLLVAAGIVAFLCVGHFMKIRENRTQHAIVTSGRRGEVQVTRILQQALSDDSYIFNDLSLKSGRNTAQIDHLVISPKGMFVIETKNWRGLIQGDEKEDKWSQVKNPGEKPIMLSNPIRQNERHVKVLRNVLDAADIDWPDVFSAVVFRSPKTKYEIRNQTVPVLYPAGLGRFVSAFTASRTYTDNEINAAIDLFMKAT